MTSTEHARRRVGDAVRHERSRRGLSVESAIKAGGLGHMTWRRIERGEPVQGRSYTGVDKAFDWPAGHTLAVVESENEAIDLVATAQQSFEPDPEPTLAEFESSFQRTGIGAEFESAYEQVLFAFEQLSLSDLRTFKTLFEQRINEHTKRLSQIHSILELGRSTNVRSVFTSYDPRLATVAAQAGDPAVGEVYEKAFTDFWDAWSDMQQLNSRVGELEVNRPSSMHTLDQLWGEASEACYRLDQAMNRLAGIHDKVDELIDNNRSLPREGTAMSRTNPTEKDS